MTDFPSVARSLLYGAAALGLVACDPAPQTESARDGTTSAAPEATVTEDFRTFLEDAYEEQLLRSPTTLTARGRAERKDEWNDISDAFRDQTLAIRRARLTALNAVDTAALDPALQLSHRLYNLDHARREAADKFRHKAYAIHQLRGPHSSVPAFLINMHRVSTVADAEAYIARLQGVGAYFDQVIEQIEIRTEAGVFLPRWSYPQMIEAAGNVITGAPYGVGTDSTILADFRKKVAGLGLDDARATVLIDEAATALKTVVAPAYGRLVAALEAQGALAGDDDGVWKFEGGDEFYAERLANYTTTDLTADEIHQLGLDNVTRIHEEMKGVMATVEFTGSLHDFFDFMRTDAQFYYPQTDAGRAAYLVDATALIDTMRAELPAYFTTTPQAPIIVKRVEAFRERSAGKAFYQSPAEDGSRPGTYYANLYRMADMPRYQMEALAYHEGIPGHHMQRALTIEMEGVPSFQRYASFTAFTEGWGLYSEYLPKDMGFYQDPYSDFGRLAMELWRACRLVVDTGIHARRWTRAEAIQYLLDNTPNAEGDSIKAIERYIVMPGQATAYMIGKIRILDLREQARATMGDRFDLRGFHDTVLKDGPVPMQILEEKVKAWAGQ